MKQVTPNPSIERTHPGKPGHASHVKRQRTLMPKLKILAAALFAFCNAAFAFDHSAYQVQGVDQIIEQGRAIEPERKSGFKLMTPPKR